MLCGIKCVWYIFDRQIISSFWGPLHQICSRGKWVKHLINALQIAHHHTFATTDARRAFGLFSRKITQMYLADIKQNHCETAAEKCFSLDEFLRYFSVF